MKSLSNQLIISTRPLTENDSIKEQLTAKGACVLDFPMIKTVGLDLNKKLESVLKQVEDFKWIVFTSKNGVIHFFRLLNELKISQKLIETKKIAVIGKSTGEEVLRHNTHPHLISSGKNALDLLAEIQKEITPTDKVLLALGELAESKLETGLNEICIAQRINVYKTEDIEYKSSEIINRIRRDDYQMILFTSPSGYRNFNKIMIENNISSKIRAACIGKTTESELLKNNCQPLIVSPKSDAISFANEIDLFLNNNIK